VSAGAGGFDRLLDVLGHDPGAAVVVCHKRPGEAFTPVWTTADKAPEVADDHSGADVWFSVNSLPHKGSGRGTASDVTRLSAVYADLDVKAGGMTTMSAAVAVIRTVSDMLGTVPTAIVETGHGLQPYWPLDRDDRAAAITDDTRGDVVALLRRFGRLVGHVAAKHGGQVDSVYDLARVLRAPGTVNHKAEPVPTRLALAEGRPLTVAEVDETLTMYNAVEQPGDRDQLGAVVAPAAEWAWAETTHPAVTRAVASWSRQTPKGRHPWLLGCATSLAFARRLGWVTDTDHAAAVVTVTLHFHELLQRSADRRDPSPGEVADAFAFGVAAAERKSEADARADWAFWTDLAASNGTSPTVDGATADTFWSARPVLEHIRAYARARRASPWAVLGVVLARVVVAVPPHIVLPPQVGGVASLNVFVGLVGESGAGKGAAEAAGADAVQVGRLNKFPVGSGEGLSHLFVRREKKELIQHTTAVLAEMPEVDTLAALNSRQGSTLQPVLRQAYMGEQFGFGYADPTKRLVVEQHRYRLCLIVGIQPARAGAILDDTHGGTPQRYLWLPATDRVAPDVAPAAPEPWRWRPPTWPRHEPATGQVHLPVCDTARSTIDEARAARLRGDGDALDGHGLLARLKVGAALALLDGRAEVADDDWNLAGTVLDVSDRTRARVVDTLRQSRADVNRRRGEAEGERAVIVTEKVEDATVRRVARALTRKLGGAPDGMVGADLRRRLAGRDRGHFDAAIDRLLSAGQIIREDITGQGTAGVSYRLAEGVR